MHLSSREYRCYLWGMTPHPGFRYIAGDPALDFVNTVIWAPALFRNERLRDYASLTHWAEGAGVLSPADARRLRRVAAAHPREAAAALRRAHALRAAIRDVFTGVAETGSAGPALEELTAAAAEALRHRRLEPVTGTPDAPPARWTWSGGDRLDSVLWPVAFAAAELVVSDEARSVRVCGGEECGWMFVDRSRNGLRRWCQMEECGTLAKSRRRAHARQRDRRSALPRAE